MRRGFRNSTLAGSWTSSIRENFYECVDPDPEALQIWCYSDALSYPPGADVSLHIATTAASYDIDIWRDGVNTHRLYSAKDLEGNWPDTPEDCSVAGCGWPVALRLKLPRDCPSGGYVVITRCRDASGARAEHHHVFLVRGAPERPADMLLLAATSTWCAYNDWGGSNHYDGITGPGRDRFSPILSTQRPWSRGFVTLPEGAPRIPLREPPTPGAAPRYPHMEWAYANGYSKKYASAGWASYERHFVHWAERTGYSLDIAAQHDLPIRPELLEAYRCVVIVGHDEYWSWEMRDAMDAYLDGGGRLARFAGNFLWQIRLEDEGRRQVCYKYSARKADPLRESEQAERTTICWDAPETGRPAALTMGLSGSRGLYAGWGGCVPRGPGGFTIYRPEHWAFNGADLYYGDLLGAAARIFGYEVDAVDYVIKNGLPFATRADGAPDGIEILGLGLATLLEEDHGNHGTDLFIGDEDVRFLAEAIHGATGPEAIQQMKRGAGMIASYRRGQGEVFNAGSCEWLAGLIARDRQVERVTKNVLDRYTGRRH